jgi:thymidylate synthase
MLIERSTFAFAYQKLCNEILALPEHEVGPRGLQTKELRNVQLTIQNPLSNLFWTEYRQPDERYLAGELLWYFRASNLLEDIQPYSKFWDKLANPDHRTLNSAYGYLIFKSTLPTPATEMSWPSLGQPSEWNWAYTKLIEDKDTRQSIIRFNKPEHSFALNKDFVCTLTGIFHIREDKLHFTINMRSSDMWFGLTYDVPFFTLLQQQMCLHLLDTYPNLKLGTFTMNLASAHIYERNYEDVHKMLADTIEPDQLPEMKVSFIQSSGDMTFEFMQLKDAITRNEPLTIEDELYRWIYDKARNKD